MQEGLRACGIEPLRISAVVIHGEGTEGMILERAGHLRARMQAVHNQGRHARSYFSGTDSGKQRHDSLRACMLVDEITNHHLVPEPDESLQVKQVSGQDAQVFTHAHKHALKHAQKHPHPMQHRVPSLYRSQTYWVEGRRG